MTHVAIAREWTPWRIQMYYPSMPWVRSSLGADTGQFSGRAMEQWQAPPSGM